MNVLAIDCSTEIASVALLTAGELICVEQESAKTHAQFLLPMIDGLLHQASVSMKQLDGIIFGRGPGSFTGLRIACSIAKGLAFAHDLPLYPVSSLASIAYSVSKNKEYESFPVLALLDARMNEMYWGYFTFGQYEAIEEVSAVSDIEIPKTKKIVLAGVGVHNYWDELPAGIKSLIQSEHTVYPNASAMIGLVEGGSISPVSAEEAKPVYVRNKVTQGGSHG